MSGDYRLGTVAASPAPDPTTGLCTVTVDGTAIVALALGNLPAAGATVWVEQRGPKKQDWVITDLHTTTPTVTHTHGHLIQSTNVGDVTSGTAVDIYTVPTLTVPAWAQDGAHTLWARCATNVPIITATSTFQTRVVIGGTSPDEGNISFQFAGAAGDQFEVVAAGTFTIPNGTLTYTSLKFQAWRTAGTGAARFNTGLNNVYAVWDWSFQ